MAEMYMSKVLSSSVIKFYSSHGYIILNTHLKDKHHEILYEFAHEGDRLPCPESGGCDCPIALTWIKENIYLRLYGIRGLVSPPPAISLIALKVAYILTLTNCITLCKRCFINLNNAMTLITLAIDLTDNTFFSAAVFARRLCEKGGGR